MDPPPGARRAGTGSVPLSFDDPSVRRLDSRDLYLQSPAQGSTIQHARFNEAWIMLGRREMKRQRGPQLISGEHGLARTRSIRGSSWGCSGSAGFSTMRTGRRSIRCCPCSRASLTSAIPRSVGWVRRSCWSMRCVAVFRLHGRSAVAPAADHAGTGVLEPDLRGHGVLRGVSSSWSSFAGPRAWASRSTSRRRCRCWPITTDREPARAR